MNKSLSDNITGRLTIKKVVYTNLQIEAACLWAQGLKEEQIADKLGRAQSNIHRALKDFSQIDAQLRMDFKRLEKAGYFKKRRFQESPTKFKELIEKRLQNKLIPPRRLPFGYKWENGEIIQDPEKAKIVKQIFIRRIEGKSIPQITKEIKEFKLRPDHVRQILTNKMYCGEFKWKGEFYPGKYEPIIDKEAWCKAQQTFSPLKTVHWTRPPYGYKIIWPEGCIVVDPEEAEKVRRIFELRLEHTCIYRIGKEVGLPHSLISRILKRKEYMGSEGVPRIVDPETWRAAQHVPSLTFKEAARIHAAKKKIEGRKTRDAILKALPGRIYEIAERVGRHPTTVCEWLHKLEAEGEVKRPEKRRGIWKRKRKT